MNRKLFTFVAAMMIGLIGALADVTPNGIKNGEAVIFNGGRPQRLIDEMPQGWYYPELRRLTIEFPVVGFKPYVLSVTSGYATLDYYVTTPQMCVLISPDTVEVDLLLETDGGDLYWGSFDTTSGTLTE